MKLYPYKMASQSAKALADALGIKRIKHEGKPLRLNEVVINWGCSKFKRDIAEGGILNVPARVAIASNKLETFKTLEGKVSIPEWTKSREEAKKWLREGFAVVARHKLSGHSGEGIEILRYEGEDELDGIPAAPLYTKYVTKKEEYRIHVFQGEIIFRQRKARKREIPDEQVNWAIRNHTNGFIFAHKDLIVPEVVEQQSIAAVDALGLDFGAVDCIYHPRTGATVLEVNTACGLEGETLNAYANAFRGFM